MKKKVTVNIEESVKLAAQMYALQNNSNLSALIESLLTEKISEVNKRGKG